MPAKKSRSSRGRSIAKHAGPAPTVRIRVDPKRRALYEKLMAQLGSASAEEALGFDAKYEAIGAIIDGQLYVDGGYETADAFLSAEVREPKRTAMRNVRVARYASPQEEKRYGTVLLDAALSYIEAQTGGPLDGKLPIKLEALRIPIASAKGAVKRSLEDLTAADVVAATRALTRKSGTTRARSSPAEQAIADAVHAVGSLAKVTVSVREGLVRFGGVPVAAFEHFVRALGKAKLGATASGGKTRTSAKKGRAK